MLRLPWLVGTSKAGNGAPVVVLPGFLTSDASTVFLRAFLAALDYRPVGWGLGRSTGSMLQYLAPVARLVEEQASRSGEQVRLVGWSRGGMIAREVAREYPDLVKQVITLGTPIHGGVGATSISALVARQVGTHSRTLAQALDARRRTPIRVPVTALYSKSDGVVAWRACIEPEADSATEHIEVRSTHVGMAFNASVLRWVARRLMPL